MGCNPSGSSVHGILQARILGWVAMPSSGDLSDAGTEPVSPASPALQADSLLLSRQGGPLSTHAKSQVTQTTSSDNIQRI